MTPFSSWLLKRAPMMSSSLKTRSRSSLRLNPLKISTTACAKPAHPRRRRAASMPNNEVELDMDDTLQIIRLVDALEDLDDVQAVYSTLSISDEVMAHLEAA